MVSGGQRDATQLGHHGGNLVLPGVAQLHRDGDAVDIAAGALGAAEGSRIEQAEHFGQDLDAAAEGLLQQLLFSGHQSILLQRGSKGLRHRFPAARLGEKAENAAFVDSVDGRFHLGVAGKHDAGGVG